MNNVITVTKLLRSIASGTNAQEQKHDVIFLEAANLLEKYYVALKDVEMRVQYGINIIQIMHRRATAGTALELSPPTETLNGALEIIREAYAYSTSASLSHVEAAND